MPAFSWLGASMFLLLLAIAGVMIAVVCLETTNRKGGRRGSVGATGATGVSGVGVTGAAGAAGGGFAVATYTGGASFTIASGTPSTFYRLEGGGTFSVIMPAASTIAAGTEYLFELMGGGSVGLVANGSDRFTGSIITGSGIARGTRTQTCSITGASAGDYGIFISDGISTWLSSGSTAGSATFT